LAQSINRLRPIFHCLGGILPADSETKAELKSEDFTVVFSIFGVENS